MRPRETAILCCFAIMALLATGCETESAAPLQAENARLRALIPGQDKTVGYFDLSNSSAVPVTLIRAESEHVRAIEFHTTSMDDGIMRMRRRSTVTVPPATTIHFQPGGDHLMLFGVRSLEQKNPIRLIFEDDTMLLVEFRQIPIGEQ